MFNLILGLIVFGGMVIFMTFVLTALIFEKSYHARMGYREWVGVMIVCQLWPLVFIVVLVIAIKEVFAKVLKGEG